MSKQRQTIYYETARDGLIACKFLGWTETPLGLGYNATVQLKRSCAGYDKGEVIRVPARVIVIKAGRKDYHQMVKSAILPVRTVDNTLPKPNYF
jgi:hypothetical protein